MSLYIFGHPTYRHTTIFSTHIFNNHAYFIINNNNTPIFNIKLPSSHHILTIHQPINMITQTLDHSSHHSHIFIIKNKTTIWNAPYIPYFSKVAPRTSKKKPLLFPPRWFFILQLYIYSCSTLQGLQSGKNRKKISFFLQKFLHGRNIPPSCSLSLFFCCSSPFFWLIHEMRLGGLNWDLCVWFSLG